MNKKKIAVIGAGISGLTCAYNLQQAGHEVVVFEKEGTVGGRMKSRKKDTLNFDIGANHLVPLYHHLRKYVADFGLEWYAFSKFGYGIFKDGEVKKPFDSISTMTKLKLFGGSLSGRKTTFDQFLNLSLISEYDTENGYEYLQKKIGEEATHYLGDGFVSAYQFYGLSEVSKAIVMAGIESMQHEQQEWDLHLTRGGMSALPNAFAERLDVRLNTGIEQVEHTDEGVIVDGETYDAVVLASTASATKSMYKNPSDEQAKILNSISYSSSMVVAYRIPIALCPEVTLVWTPKIESPIVASYSLEQTKGRDVIDGEETLLLVFLHDDAAKNLMNKSDDDVYESVRNAFANVGPWLADTSVLKPYDLQRWAEAMPTYPHGSLTRVKNFMETHQGDHHVWFCGDYLNAPWVEGALRCGERVAEAMVEKYGD